jgi:Domain of unknown function (DUF6046)
MAAFQIILQSLGLQGLKPAVYRAQIGRELEPRGGDYPKQFSDSYGNIVGDQESGARTSWLGTPVFSDLAIVNRDEGQEDIVFDTILIEVSQRKNIVTTPVQGRNGTVKEYVSDGDYDVRLRGAVVSNGDNRYPYEEVRDLHQALSSPTTLTIACDYLRLFNVYSLVVTGFRFPQSEGFQNMQSFEIDCISDAPEELIQEDATTNQ